MCEPVWSFNAKECSGMTTRGVKKKLVCGRFVHTHTKKKNTIVVFIII